MQLLIQLELSKENKKVYSILRVNNDRYVLVYYDFTLCD